MRLPVEERAEHPLTDDLFENDSFCMAGLRSRTLGIYEKDTGKELSAMWRVTPIPSSGRLRQSQCALSALSRGTPLPGAQTDTQEWSQRAAAACLAPGQTWETTLSTTFER